MSDANDVQLSISALNDLSEIENPGTESDTRHIDSPELRAELTEKQNALIDMTKELLQMTLGNDEHSLDKDVESQLNHNGFSVLHFDDGIGVRAGDWKLTL